jgi:hypothetical protein
MPAGDAVAGEELSAARARQTYDMLEVRGRGSHGAHRRRVERPSYERQRQNTPHAACDLEAP